MRDTKFEINHFWFEELEPHQWFEVNETVDEEIRYRFEINYKMARDGLCKDWASDAKGALASIILLDQFPRNMYRDSEKAFATDQDALLLTKEAIHKGFDDDLNPTEKVFLYMPFQHSEVLSDQIKSLELFGAIADHKPKVFDFAKRHYNAIKKFGRFPHRNKILGRKSTAEEIDFLKNKEGFL